ncbi:hypothetical protein E0H75_42285 [Kribbella capetownensis]|uniref:Uncharacterized protein n=1 Tax=Kribbella capetownensis TaxID=1572659 RepID=A0A4R0IM09_9ACTN|nr:hypothetical protein [Kribbella capetownensis]TCC33889.1 hypothetical protein E0H75_42285 [Kribbella capetownensis]
MTKNISAIDEQARPPSGAAGGAGEDSFAELLAAATPRNWDNYGGAPESAHARLDEALRQRRAFDREDNYGGDVDDALVQLIDRASACTEPSHGRTPSRPTWIIHDTSDNWVVDRAGDAVIYLHYLPEWRSRELVSFVEYSDPITANAVVADLLEENLFATIRPDIARMLVHLAFEPHRRMPPAFLRACTQAMETVDFFGETSSWDRSAREDRTTCISESRFVPLVSRSWLTLVLAKDEGDPWASFIRDLGSCQNVERRALERRPQCRELTTGHSQPQDRSAAGSVNRRGSAPLPGHQMRRGHLVRIRKRITRHLRRALDMVAVTLTAMALTTAALLIDE